MMLISRWVVFANQLNQFYPESNQTETLISEYLI